MGARKGGERNTTGTWPTSTPPGRGGAEGGARRQTVGEEDASAGPTCGDWTCPALSTLSITQIIRSEKRRGRSEAECMMGLMDGCVPGSRCAAILGADKCQKDGGAATESLSGGPRRPSLRWTSTPTQLPTSSGVGPSQTVHLNGLNNISAVQRCHQPTPP